MQTSCQMQLIWLLNRRYIYFIFYFRHYIHRHIGYGSLHISVTSQPKTIGHFTAYPKQIEFDFGHFTAYYLLVGVCCPRVIYVVNLISFIDIDIIKHCGVWYGIDILHVYN